jgi:hypothetical protein
MQSCGGDNSISFNTVGFRSQCLASSKWCTCTLSNT